MKVSSFEFPAPVLRQETGRRYHYLPLPQEVAAALLAGGTRRVIATLNGREISRAVVSDGAGRHVLLTGAALLRQVGVTLGDVVHVALRPDPSPEAIELGEELIAALEEDEAAAARFYAMTPGRRRSLASYVTSARRAETRLKRALALAEKLRTFALYGDRTGDR